MRCRRQRFQAAVRLSSDATASWIDPSTRTVRDDKALVRRARRLNRLDQRFASEFRGFCESGVLHAPCASRQATARCTDGAVPRQFDIPNFIPTTVVPL